MRIRWIHTSFNSMYFVNVYIFILLYVFDEYTQCKLLEELHNSVYLAEVQSFIARMQWRCTGAIHVFSKDDQIILRPSFFQQLSVPFAETLLQKKIIYAPGPRTTRIISFLALSLQKTCFHKHIHALRIPWMIFILEHHDKFECIF
jgi:hypothetical protein